MFQETAQASNNLVVGALLALSTVLLSIAAFFLRQTWDRIDRMDKRLGSVEVRTGQLETINDVERRLGGERRHERLSES